MNACAQELLRASSFQLSEWIDNIGGVFSSLSCSSLIHSAHGSKTAIAAGGPVGKAAEGAPARKNFDYVTHIRSHLVSGCFDRLERRAELFKALCEMWTSESNDCISI
mmetsp:Transcript_734/g.1364  ORF Transcript_734/g.1364 Transcript_734/m.1364 type:complete len:108 (-) Transcript_734:462-785(-)